MPPLTWSELTGPIYTPGFGEVPGAPGLGTATWSWNPATQAFRFNPLGATRGTYVWSGSASNVFGLDVFSIRVDVVLPEPASVVLIALAALVFSVRVRQQASGLHSADRTVADRKA